MPIVNRNLDKTQQREIYQQEWSTLATGSTVVLLMAPYPAAIDFIQYAATGLSGTPNVQVLLNRFIAGTGYTSFNIGSTNALIAFGTSGVATYGFSLPAIGSTLTQLQTNDLLVLQTGGTNAGFQNLVISAVIRPIQDIVKFYNLI